jgi:hypothetical protein
LRPLALLVAVVLVLAACTGPAPKHRGGALSPSHGGPVRGSAPGIPSAPPSAVPSPAPSGSRASAAGWWQPRAGLTWQWQLTGALDTSVEAEVYDVDAFSTSASDVAKLHAAGRHVVCYVNVGAYEDFRPDAARFPAEVRGRALEGWPGEAWLDIRRWDLLEPLLSARFARCRDKGFDGVEPDNVDGYSNESGFPLTAGDQLVFNRRVADLAHRYGLAVGLKNDVEQAGALAPAFDFAVNEECSAYRECERLAAFTAAGKPVFHVEYAVSTDQFCPATKALGFSSMRKRTELDAWREPC